MNYIYLSVVLFLSTMLLGMSSAPRIYVPITRGTVITQSTVQESDKKSSSKKYNTQIYQNQDMFPEGSQTDINQYNLMLRSKYGNSRFTPQSFDTGSNSYWLQPDFQMGPGSVNDFGGDPNAEQIVGPYIY